MVSTISERLSEVLADTGMRAADLARLAKVSKAAVTQWLDGTAQSIGPKAAFNIQDGTRFSARWIMFGEGPKSVERSVADDEIPLSVQMMRSVPVVGTTQAGPPDRVWLETGHPTGTGDTLLQIATMDENAYALRVVGDSMSPRVLEGDYVVLAPNFEPRPGCDVVVRTVHGDVMLKRLEAKRTNEIVLASVNEAFRRRILDIREIELMHRVAAYVPADMAGAIAKAAGSVDA